MLGYPRIPVVQTTKVKGNDPLNPLIRVRISAEMEQFVREFQPEVIYCQGVLTRIGDAAAAYAEAHVRSPAV